MAETFLFEENYKLDRLVLTGKNLSSLALEKRENPFWNVVTTPLYVTNRKYAQISCVHKNVGTENILFLDWLKHDVHIIGDLLNSDNDILSISHLK